MHRQLHNNQRQDPPIQRRVVQIENSAILKILTWPLPAFVKVRFLKMHSPLQFGLFSSNLELQLRLFHQTILIQHLEISKPIVRKQDRNQTNDSPLFIWCRKIPSAKTIIIWRYCS